MLSDEKQMDGFIGIRQILEGEAFLLKRPNGNQAGYRGRYFSGRLAMKIQRLSISDRSVALVYLLARKGATELDGEVAYEFKNVFFGADFSAVATEARRALSEEMIRTYFTAEELSRAREWLHR